MIASASPKGQDALLFFRLNTILKARALHSNLRACAGFRDARSGTLHGVTSEASGAAGGAPCLYGVRCRCSCSLIVKEELNIFSLGISPDLEAEEKMWWGVGRGLESEMRSRDDLRRQARTLFPGQRRRSRRANQ